MCETVGAGEDKYEGVAEADSEALSPNLKPNRDTKREL